jgi:hypothetical protein
MKSEKSNCCHVIAFWAGDRRFEKEESGYAIKLLSYIWDIHTKVDGGLNFDIIIVNNTSGNKESEDFLSKIDGKRTKNGMIKVIHRENIGISYGAYSYAYQIFKNEYDYWFFTEDDMIFNKLNWYKMFYDSLVSEMEDVNSKVAFIAANGIVSVEDSKHTWHKKCHAHNGMGITHSKFISDVCDKYIPVSGSECSVGNLPYGNFKGWPQNNESSLFSYPHNSSKFIALITEVNFTNCFVNIGYELKELFKFDDVKLHPFSSWFNQHKKVGIYK